MDVATTASPSLPISEPSVAHEAAGDEENPHPNRNSSSETIAAIKLIFLVQEAMSSCMITPASVISKLVSSPCIDLTSEPSQMGCRRQVA